VEWLGEVPEHWQVVQFKELIDIQNGADHKAIEVEEGFPVLGSGGVFAYASDYHYDGEAVLLGRKGTIDRPLHVTGKFWTVDTMYWSRIRTGMSGRFAYYTAVMLPFEYYSTNTAVPSMTKGNLSAHRVVRPPLSEQVAVVAFLDRETAKIDELVAEQQRLMELLKEKRQAVISHAVTKGLKANVPMKPSGVEWLGEVPAHWRLARLKHVKAHEPNAFVDGPFGSNLKSEHFIDDGDVYVIESGFATQGHLDVDDLKTISSQHFSTIARSATMGGDIIIAKIGAQFGRASILPVLDKPAVVSGNSMKLTVNSEICATAFLHLLLIHLKSIGAIDDIVNATAQPALSLGEMNNIEIVVPPRDEQESIVEEIRESLAALDSLSAEANRSTELLRERRSALISAAVTGQIDVRHLAQEAAA
jgi:type I restriction enzyme S subunit